MTYDASGAVFRNNKSCVEASVVLCGPHAGIWSPCFLFRIFGTAKFPARATKRVANEKLCSGWSFLSWQLAVLWCEGGGGGEGTPIKMNKPQRITLFAAVGLIIAMCLYSPRVLEVRGRHMSGGYYFILDQWHYNDPIDFSRLFSQIVIVLIIAALLVVAFKKAN